MRRAILVPALALSIAACSPAPEAPAPQPPAAAADPVPEAEPAPATEAVPEPEPQPAPAVAESWELPGGIGPLTTRLELEARFGKDNIREERFAGAEGEGDYPALVVYPDDPRRRLELVLDAENPDAPIQELRIASTDSDWHEASGLHAGMSLAELVELNGAPVSFYGLGWDYGGTIHDWHGGRLANGIGRGLFRRVVLAARAGAGEAGLPQGDGSFRSDDGKWRAAATDLVVASIGISWPDDE